MKVVSYQSMNNHIVSLDLWGTIFDFRTEMKAAEIRRGIVNEFAARRGLDNQSLVEETYRQTSIHFYSKYERESVTLTPRERLTHHLELLNLDPSGEDFEQLVIDVQNAIIQGPPPFAANLEMALKELSSRYRLIIVSDTGFSPGIAVREIFRDRGIDKYFSDYSFSDENGFSKPDKRAFISVLERVGGTPSRFWHIGDTERTDIKGPHNIGGRSCLYTGLLDQHPDGTEADFVLHDWKDVTQLIEEIERF